MIYGIGTDIIAIGRIEALLARYGDRFAKRILAPAEWEAFRVSLSPARFLAKRFAAKEAFSKALGTGIRWPTSWHNIAIGHTALGRPRFDLGPALAKTLEREGIGGCHLSISDEEELAVAFVVLER